MYLGFCTVYHLTCFFSQITLDSSGLQFTPNGQSLVLLNCIKVPCCRLIPFELFKLMLILHEVLGIDEVYFPFLFSGREKFLVHALYVHQIASRRMQ